MKRTIIATLMLSLFAAACQPADEVATTAAPPAQATCLVGTADCDDTGSDALPPPNLPDGDLDAPVVEVPFDGGMSVESALEQEEAEPITITASLIGPEGEFRLCDSVAESLPPQCGEPSILIANPDQVDLDDLRLDQGIYWSERPLTLPGSISDGVFTISFG